MVSVPEQPPPTPELPQAQVRSRLFQAFFQNGPLIASVFVALVFCIIIGSLFWPFVKSSKEGTTLLRELATFEVARGLITFLVAVTTVGIALILTVFVVVTQDQAAEKKFALGKEVLTGLIGVLGTIVGFYFGSGTTQTSAPPISVPAIAIKEIKVDPQVVKPGDTFQVSVSTGGIKAPVDYAFIFTPENIVPNKTGTSDKPEFSTDVNVPPGAVAAALEVTLQLKDKKGGTPIELIGVTRTSVKIAP